MIICILVFSLALCTPDFTEQIKSLQTKLQANYWNTDQKYKFMQSWEHQKGLFASSVHLNSIGLTNSKLAQWERNRLINIPDNNMFVTSFVLYGLIEANQLGTVQLDSHQLSQSLQALSKFRDRNEAYGIPKYIFWPQQMVNGTWTAQPDNLFHVINSAPTFPPAIQMILNYIGLGILAIAKNFGKAFRIPPDNDDSSVNMALLGMLKETNSSHYNYFNSLNFNKQAYYELALKYAYRPFGAISANKHADEIDPRTYFVYHDFIEAKYQEPRNPGEAPSLVLPTTWLINSDEQVPDLVTMPFNTNNVDATVCANFLFGLAYQAIQKQVTITPELYNMILDTSDLIEFALSRMIQKRPDITLVYYPSQQDFYWFVARIVNLLGRYKQVPQPFDVVYSQLNLLMTTVGTQHILNHQKFLSNGDGYWSQFLGNYGKKNRNDDALFSTALAMNSLLDTWTQRKGPVVTYRDRTPKEVRKALQAGANFLQHSFKYKKFYLDQGKDIWK